MLKYNWANISSFCFSTEFIKRAKEHLDQTGQYHIAKKKIPSVLGPVQVMRVSFDQDSLIRKWCQQLYEELFTENSDLKHCYTHCLADLAIQGRREHLIVYRCPPFCV